MFDGNDHHHYHYQTEKKGPGSPKNYGPKNEMITRYIITLKTRKTEKFSFEMAILFVFRFFGKEFPEYFVQKTTTTKEFSNLEY